MISGGHISDAEWERLRRDVAVAIHPRDAWEIVPFPPGNCMCTGCGSIRPARSGPYDPWKDHDLEHEGAGRPE